MEELEVLFQVSFKDEFEPSVEQFYKTAIYSNGKTQFRKNMKEIFELETYNALHTHLELQMDCLNYSKHC